MAQLTIPEYILHSSAIDFNRKRRFGFSVHNIVKSVHSFFAKAIDMRRKMLYNLYDNVAIHRKDRE